MTWEVRGDSHGATHTYEGPDPTPGVVPRGGIIMWQGSIVPYGWALCDGDHGTPNLVDRFVVGTGLTYAIGDSGGAPGETLTHSGTAVAFSGGTNHAGGTSAVTFTGGSNHSGGSQTLSHTQNHSGNHTHDASAFIEVGASPGSGVFAWDYGSGGSHKTTSIQSGLPNSHGDHTANNPSAHSATVPNPSAHTLSVTQPDDHVVSLPPYYALAFIMRLN